MFIVIKKKTIVRILTVLTVILMVSIYGTYSYQLNFIYPKTSDKVITEEVELRFRNLFQSSDKIAYLSFDDGPVKNITPKVLDILKELDVKANFFVVGKHVKEEPELVKRMYEEGHFIGNHTYSHNNKKIYKNQNSFISEIQNTDKEIGKAIGDPNFSCHVFRFPNGSHGTAYRTEKMQGIESLKEIDYTYVNWNSLNNDSIKKYSRQQLLNNLKKSSKNKNVLVVLMHDTGDLNKTYDVLEDSISYLKSQGYEFQTFDHLIHP